MFCSLLFQSSSIDFLASQGFDFNKVFRNGKITSDLSLALVNLHLVESDLSVPASETESQGPAASYADLEL